MSSKPAIGLEDFAPLDLDIPLHQVSTDDGQPIDLAPIERSHLIDALGGT